MKSTYRLVYMRLATSASKYFHLQSIPLTRYKTNILRENISNYLYLFFWTYRLTE